MQWDQIFAALADKKDLSSDQIKWGMGQILEGVANNEDIKAFLTGLKSKGETAEEVEALISQMYKYCTPINVLERCVETSYAKGNIASTIDISVLAAIITNAAGARVVVHGDHVATSNSGSADQIEALGVRIDLTSKEVEQTVHKIGIGFCFSPIYHASMKYTVAARRELGVPTIFDILGVLANPVKPIAVAIGVAQAELLPLIIKVLLDQGREGFIFQTDHGLDAVSSSTQTMIVQINGGEFKTEIFYPADIGMATAALTALPGGDTHFNALMVKQMLTGKETPIRGAVILNAALAIAAFKGDFALPLQTQIANALVLANRAIDSGAAVSALNRWIELSNTIAETR